MVFQFMENADTQMEPNSNRVGLQQKTSPIILKITLTDQQPVVPLVILTRLMATNSPPGKLVMDMSAMDTSQPKGSLASQSD